MRVEEEILEGCNCPNCHLGRIEKRLEEVQEVLKEIQKNLKKKR